MGKEKRDGAEKVRLPDHPTPRQRDDFEIDLLDNGTISSMEMTGIAPAALPENEVGAAAFNQLWTNPTRMLGAKPTPDEMGPDRNDPKPHA